MSRKYAEVQVAIWDEADFIALDEDAQRLYFVLMTRIDLSLAGVISWNPGRIAQLAKNSTSASITKAAKKLEMARFVVIDRDTDECLIRTQVRHDGVLSRGPKLAGGVLTAWRAIYSRKLKSIVASEVHKADGISESVLIVLAPMLEWASDTSCDTPSGEVSGHPATSNQQPATSRPASTHADEEFEKFWKLYPRRVGKGQAAKAYASARKKTSAASIAGAIIEQVPKLTAVSDPKFIPMPSTWLNGERWLDETPVAQYEPNSWMRSERKIPASWLEGEPVL